MSVRYQRVSAKRQSDRGEKNLTRNITDMDIIYVEGLVAGTEYTIRVTVSNVFGSEIRSITTTPLIGYILCVKVI